MTISEAFQSYYEQSNDTSISTAMHQDGHIDYVSGSDDYTVGEHHDKHVDCDAV